MTIVAAIDPGSVNCAITIVDTSTNPRNIIAVDLVQFGTGKYTVMQLVSAFAKKLHLYPETFSNPDLEEVYIESQVRRSPKNIAIMTILLYHYEIMKNDLQSKVKKVALLPALHKFRVLQTMPECSIFRDEIRAAKKKDLKNLSIRIGIHLCAHYNSDVLAMAMTEHKKLDDIFDTALSAYTV